MRINILAQEYNKLMNDVDYDAWAFYINSLLGMKKLRIFEAACGTEKYYFPAL